MTTSQQSRLGDAPEEGIKAPVVTISSGQETLFGTGQSIAGVVIADQDRVCINAQTDPLENGIYVARNGKDWVRATDMNGPDDVQTGQLLSDENTSAVYSLTVPPGGWLPGLNSLSFGLLLSPVGFFWGAITGTLSNQADLQAELDAKAAAVHTHVEADITDLQAYILDAAGSIALDGEYYARRDAAWEVIDFSVFAPAVHTHVEADITDLQPYLLDAAGSIAMDDQLWARANGIWQAFTTSSGTVGEILAWPDEDPPDNFLTCDGSSQNAVTFADLFAVLGYKYGGSGANFNLPDLRGEFIRGAANGSGNDPDRLLRTDRGDGVTGDNVGTKQAQALGPHSHTFSAQQNIGGFTDNGGAPDQRSTQQNASTGSTGTGIENDTRPRNVYMNYIIRWTGGGSGITSPPTVEVQDSGITLTTAVQLLNYEGFVLTQPVTDEITITIGASLNSAVYCPGYIFTFVNTITWRVVGENVTNLFSQGRRLRFIDGAATYHGTIVSSVFVTDTDITMSMEGGDVLTTGISEVCLTTSAAGWSPIAGDPFGGTPIRDLTSGFIGGTKYWIIVGDAGRIAFSTDGGVTWTIATSGTTENLNKVDYNPDSQTFVAVGQNMVICRSTDGETFTADTAEIAALITDGPGHVIAVWYDETATDTWLVLFQVNLASGQFASAFSTDDGVNWVIGDPVIATVTQAGTAGLETYRVGAGGTVSGVLHAVGEDVNFFSNAMDTTSSIINNTSGQAQVESLLTVARASGGTIIIGRSDGSFWLNTAENDGTTFGSSSINDMAYSLTHDRIVIVADDGKIGALEPGDFPTGNPDISLISNGSNPLADMLCVHWDDDDGVYISGNNQGQILRSTNGLDTIPAPSFTGFSLVTADPFGGTPINRIMSGAIGGDLFWVAIGGGGQLFTSTDAGVTWTQRTTGTVEGLISIGYNEDNQQFLVGCTNSTYLFSSDGINWTLDTTTLAALLPTGSGNVEGVVWDTSSAVWLIMFNFGAGASFRTYTSPTALTTWTAREIGISVLAPLTMRKMPTGNQILYPFFDSDMQYLVGALDTTDQTYLNRAAAPKFIAVGTAPGTGGFTSDAICGDASGNLLSTSATIGAGTLRGTHTAALPTVNGVVFSTASSRWIAVGDGSEIRTLDPAFMDVDNAWVTVINPFTADINDVWYDASDDMFIAVGSNGEIGRSTDGISLLPEPPPVTGFTLVTSPFGGTPIRALQTGVVTGIQYWVAVGDDGKIAVSDDEGASWSLITSNVTQNLTCIGYSSTLEQFCAGGDAGEYTYSTTLVSPLTGTWTAGDITDDFAHGDGSGRFQDISFDPDGINAWHCIWQRLSTTQGAAFSIGDPVTWSATDGGFFGIVTSKSSYVGTYVLRIMYGEDEDILGYTSAIDSGSSQLFNRTLVTVVTGFESKVGTFAKVIDVILGTTAGELFVYADSDTIRSQHNAMVGQVNQITWASALSRLVAVGANGEIWAMEQADLETNDAWTEIVNPFTADITDIKYNAVDGYFVAVAADGTIGRSVDGIS